MRLAALATALFAMMAASDVARADDLSTFHAAIEEFSAHNRVAIGYLRTDNAELAALEIERMREAWGDVVARFGKTPPAAFKDNPLWVTTFVDVPTRLVGVSLMMTMGRPPLAANGLVAIREELSALRRASGIEVLADAVLDANSAMAALAPFTDKAPDWSVPADVAALTAAADAYATAVRRCDRLASADIATRGEFRRLIDGIAASLALMPQAVAARDGDLLHRLMIELRAYDNLLAFRYG